MYRNGWISRDEKMKMVRLNFKGKNFNTFFLSNFLNNIFKYILNASNENWLSSLWTPYHMIVYKIDLITRIFVFHSVYSLSLIYKKVKGKFIPAVETEGFLAQLSVNVI